MLAPIAVFAFNRPDLVSSTLSHLSANFYASESHVTIFCDGPRSDKERVKTDAVRSIARQTTGFASVTLVERDRNYGCAASIIDGLQHMFAKYERLIVIEDDILTSPYTLKFLNDALEFYNSYESVFNISAWSAPENIFPIPKDYPYDVYAIPRFNCWGWASWRNRFESIDWDISDYQTFRNSEYLRRAFNAGGEDLSPMLDAQMEGKINSWAIRADYSRFKRGMIGINPVISYTTNIGMGSGVHCTTEDHRLDNDLTKVITHNITMPSYIFIDDKIKSSYHNFYCPYKKSHLSNIFGYAKPYFNWLPSSLLNNVKRIISYL